MTRLHHKYRPIWRFAWMVSLLAHGLFFVAVIVAPYFQSGDRQPRYERRAPVKIKIQTKPSPKKQPKRRPVTKLTPITKSPSTSQPTDTAQRNPSPAPTDQPQDQPEQPDRIMERLLPDATAQGQMVFREQGQVNPLREQGITYRGPASTDTQMSTDHVGTQFDVPLRLRKFGDRGQAITKIRRHTDGSLEFVYLDGAAYYRASLYESLIKRDQQAELHKLMDQLQVSTLIIALRFRSVASGAGLANPTSTSVQVIGNKIVVAKVFYQFGGVGGGGIPLPDEEAKRAERRDKAHVRRLQLAPAYRSPLRNRPFPKPE